MTDTIDEALTGIRQKAHWRVRLLPPSAEQRFRLPSDCFRAVSQSHVELRGWDYPHVQDASDERHGRSFPVVDGWELFVDFLSHHEAWRFTKSGQFIHYFTLWEDEEGAGSSWRIPEGTKFLSLESTIATLTEVMEFFARLVELADYTPSINIEISLLGTDQRVLKASPSRFLFRDYISHVSEIPLSRTISISEIASSRQEIALEMARDIFELFTFRIDDHVLHDIQRNILERRW